MKRPFSVAGNYAVFLSTAAGHAKWSVGTLREVLLPQPQREFVDSVRGMLTDPLRHIEVIVGIIVMQPAGDDQALHHADVEGRLPKVAVSTESVGARIAPRRPRRPISPTRPAVRPQPAGL